MTTWDDRTASTASTSSSATSSSTTSGCTSTTSRSPGAPKRSGVSSSWPRLDEKVPAAITAAAPTTTPARAVRTGMADRRAPVSTAKRPPMAAVIGSPDRPNQAATALGLSAARSGRTAHRAAVSARPMSSTPVARAPAMRTTRFASTPGDGSCTRAAPMGNRGDRAMAPTTLVASATGRATRATGAASSARRSRRTRPRAARVCRSRERRDCSRRRAWKRAVAPTNTPTPPTRSSPRATTPAASWVRSRSSSAIRTWVAPKAWPTSPGTYCAARSSISPRNAAGSTPSARRTIRLSADPAPSISSARAGVPRTGTCWLVVLPAIRNRPTTRRSS